MSTEVLVFQSVARRLESGEYSTALARNLRARMPAPVPAPVPVSWHVALHALRFAAGFTFTGALALALWAVAS